MKKGFTLPEILVAVMIVAILVVMAVPQYTKAIEKSRKAEVLSTLKKLHESKMRLLDNTELGVFQNGTFGMENLDFSLPCTATADDSYGHRIKCQLDDFDYFLYPSFISSSAAAVKNAVCATRRTGDYKNTVFIYYGEMETNEENRFVCKGTYCEVYGMTDTSSAPSCGS